MKKVLVMTCMVFGCVFTVSAKDDTGVTANERATHLSNQMIRELQLNNYQSRKVNEINLEVARQMLAIEQQYAGNQQKIDELCGEVCAMRDVKLENVLSTVQYNDYFGSRKNLVALDRQFMTEATMAQQSGNGLATANTTETTTVN